MTRQRAPRTRPRRHPPPRSFRPTASRSDPIRLMATGTMAAASAFVGGNGPLVHAGEDNTIKVAIIGCGGRGTGAAINDLSTKSGPIKLVAMADVFPDRLSDSYHEIQKLGPEK